MTILEKNFFADFLKKRSIEFLVIYIIGKAGHSTFRICNQLNWLFSKMKIFFKRSVIYIPLDLLYLFSSEAQNESSRYFGTATRKRKSQMIQFR